MQLSNQTGLIRHSVALGILLFGVGGPMYADVLTLATVEGSLGHNVAGTPGLLFDTNSQTGSPVSTVLSPSPWTFTCPAATCSGFGITGSGTAAVTNGSLHASSSITFTGSLPATSGGLADTYADYFDTLTITGGTGSGVLVLQYALDGSISHTGTGPNVDSSAAFSNAFAADYQIGSGAVTSGSEADFFGDGATNGTVTFYIPFTYGTSVFTELRLETAAGFQAAPGFAGDDMSPYTAISNFSNTASLNSALVYAGSPSTLGAQNTGAVIGSASGISYGPGGSTAVPEPQSWFLLISAIGAVAFGKRRGALRSTR